MTPVGTPNPFVMECHPIDYHPTLIRNILIIIWLKPKRCNSFNFPLIRGLIQKKNCRFRVCPCLITPVGTPNPFVMECHPTYYHPTLIRNILIIIWLKPKRCNSFNFPFIQGQVEKNANCRFRVCPCLMTPVGTPNPFVMECHPIDYHPTLIRNILIIIWLKTKRCNSFNFPLIRGLIQ